MTTFLSAMTWWSTASRPTVTSCIRMQFFTSAPRAMDTPRKRMQFSTVPSMVHPSATRQLTQEPSGSM